jgi:hypothetical protein
MAVASPPRPDPDELWRRLMAHTPNVVAHGLPDGGACVHIDPADGDVIDHGTTGATLGIALELALMTLEE